VLDTAVREDRASAGIDLAPLQQLLPRFPCSEADAAPGAAGRGYEERFGAREPARLVDLEDLNGDGHPLELALLAEFIDCARHTSLVAGVDPLTRTLHVFFERMDREPAR
jgi:hypothetical protein